MNDSAASGRQAIEWALRSSPVLDGFVRRKLADRALAGKRVAVVGRLDAKIAVLATVLADGGAAVVVADSSPESTSAGVTAALAERGVEVHARQLLSVADTEPDYIIDEGAALTARMASDRPDAYARLRGVLEGTTDGLTTLTELAALGHLHMPALAASGAECKRLFEDRHGTAQTTVQAILQLTNLRMYGKRVAVVGYRQLGRGVAMYCHQLGAQVTVIEIDPIRGLEAHADGHDVASLETALGSSDFVITTTGNSRVVSTHHFDALTDGTILANAGHGDHEIDIVALRAQSSDETEIRPGVTAFTRNGITTYVLVDGALVNVAGGKGQPSEVVDLASSVHALGCHYLASHEVASGLHPYPADLDRAIAAAKLTSRGITIDGIQTRGSE
ncbi:MAG: adenosylhomocysteinase [Candidatus Poriferisodalaceae bacterium]|jgi:adenosylhomocysteinase